MLTQDMTEEAADRAAPLIPFSCSTNLANEVNDHLRRAKLTARAWEVCSYLLRQTFGNAGWHRKLGREEWWCTFDLVLWSAALACDRSNLRRTIAELVACQIIHFEPDLAHPGEGRIGWNLTFAAWQPFDRRRQRQAGAEQARVVKILSQHILNTEMPGEAGREQPSVVRMTPCEARQAENSGGLGQKQASVVRMPSLSTGGGGTTCDLTMPACPEEGSKLTTLACSKEPLHQGSILPVRKEKRKKETETSIVVSEALGASPDVELGSLRDPLDTTSRASNEVRVTPPVSDPPGAWPPRQAWEYTDLDYFQRVLREREKERVALLTRLAHERIGVVLETACYARIGALAKRCGAALLVKHILLAAATHIDGNPLDYLTKLVHSSAAGLARKKEAFYGTARTTTGSGSNNDESTRSGWEGWDVATAR